jgi:transcriptional regulator with XRE-family HTH domain
MTGEELRTARKSLGLSAEGFARAIDASSGRAVQAWETGSRHGRPAPIPGPVALLIEFALEIPAVRIRLLDRAGQRDREDPCPPGYTDYPAAG